MGEGERAEAARRRRNAIVVMVSLGAALVLLAGTFVFKRQGGGVTPGWAIAFAVIYVGLMLGCGWQAWRGTDEVEGRATIRALALGACIYGLVYPPWSFLANAGIAPPPDGDLLYGLTVVTVMLAFLKNKLG